MNGSGAEDAAHRTSSGFAEATPKLASWRHASRCDDALGLTD
jgi:hypothetical protein